MMNKIEAGMRKLFEEALKHRKIRVVVDIDDMTKIAEFEEMLRHKGDVRTHSLIKHKGPVRNTVYAIVSDKTETFDIDVPFLQWQLLVEVKDASSEEEESQQLIDGLTEYIEILEIMRSCLIFSNSK